MARAVTLATLRSRVRQLAACENSEFPTDAEINGYLNDRIASFWEEVVADGWGRGYFEIEGNVTITGGTTTYSLPADFYSLRLCEWRLDATRRVRLLPWQLPEASYLRGAYSYAATYPSAYPSYRLRGGGTDGQTPQIEFQPPPGSSGTVVLTYVPTPPALTQDSHTIDGVCGWERWVVLMAAADVKLKEGDTAALADVVALADRELARIRRSAPHRDSGAPMVVVDVY